VHLAIKQARAEGAYVFENNNVKGGYILNLRRPIERITKRSGVAFTPHDLRRSFATYLDTVGTPFGVIKQLLNHKAKADVTERYIQRRGLQELAKYSDEVLRLLVDAAPTLMGAIESNRSGRLFASHLARPLQVIGYGFALPSWELP
jgi:integrase